MNGEKCGRNEERTAAFDRAKEILLRHAARSGGTRSRVEETPEKDCARVIAEIGQLEIYGRRNLSEFRAAVNELDAFSVRPLDGRRALLGGTVNNVWKEVREDE